MTTPAATLRARRDIWAEALASPGCAELRRGLVAELAAYLGQPEALVEARCRGGAAELARAWAEAAPARPAQIAAFYRGADAYLYDLTWWHALADDESALAQVEALEVAQAHHARAALDFGSGIGSLGLLLARHGVEVTLAEVNPRLQDYARWRFARRGCAATFLDGGAETLPAAAFDFVSAVDVLEHLPNPAATLARLAAALRPGGTLFVHLPGAADAAHPMHLWHRPATLFGRLGAAGLWLEQFESSVAQGGGSTTLVLRRGEGPRYRLNDGLDLIPDAGGGVVLSQRPLVALRLNPHAAALLGALASGSTALDLVAARPALPLNAATRFLDDLARRRLVLREPPPPAAWPAVSIVVPAHGRPGATRACVESLLALEYPAGGAEVIVVDDASEPPLAPALAGLPVQVVRFEQNRGQSAARNHAAALARGEVVALIDNDCVADPGWLAALVAALDEPRVAIVGGRVMAPPPAGPVAAFEAVRSPLDMGPASGAVGPGEAIGYMPSCNLVVRRELMLRLGGFDPAMTLGEDVDFVWRALASGAEARYRADGVVVHDHRVQLLALLRRRADYASSEADLQLRHPAGRREMVIPALGVTLLAALVLAAVAPALGLLLCALALGLLAVEIARKGRDLARNGVDLPLRQVIGAVLLEHRAALYHLGANVTRYYSLPLLAAGLLWPPLLPALAVLLLVPPIVDHRRLRPAVALPLFIALSWLELGAYQLGVWRGCRERRTLRPLLPRVRLGR